MKIKRLVLPVLAIAVTACASSPQGEAPAAPDVQSPSTVANAQGAADSLVREPRVEKKQPAAQKPRAARSVSGASNLSVSPGEKTDGILDLNLEQTTYCWIHGGFPELLGIHFTKPLEA